MLNFALLFSQSSQVIFSRPLPQSSERILYLKGRVQSNPCKLKSRLLNDEFIRRECVNKGEGTTILLNYPDLSYQVHLKDIINLRSGVELYRKRSHKNSFHNFSALFGAVSSKKRISTMYRVIKESEYDVLQSYEVIQAMDKCRIDELKKEIRRLASRNASLENKYKILQTKSQQPAKVPIALWQALIDEECSSIKCNEFIMKVDDIFKMKLQSSLHNWCKLGSPL